MGKAMTLLVERLKKQRFGHTKRPRSKRTGNKTTPHTHSETRPAEPPAQRAPSATVRRSGPHRSADELPVRNSRHIPAEVRRRVVERDGARCTFVSDAGRRCEATGMLEFHHEDPYALGGPNTVENVRLLCRPHNGLLAERDFDRDFILQMRSQKRVDHPTDPEPSHG